MYLLYGLLKEYNSIAYVTVSTASLITLEETCSGGSNDVNCQDAPHNAGMRRFGVIITGVIWKVRNIVMQACE